MGTSQRVIACIFTPTWDGMMNTTKTFSDAQVLREGVHLTANARQAKSQLITHMSHELRTPLNTILGFAQILDRCSDDTTLGDERESINLILNAGKDLLHNIESLLDLLTIEIENREGELTERSAS